MDSNRGVAEMATRAWDYQHQRPKEAQRLAIEVKAKAEANGDARALAWALVTLAYIDLRHDGYRNARAGLNEAAAIFVGLNEIRGRILASNGLARLTMMEGDIEGALAVFSANLREDGDALSALDRFYTLNGIAGCLAALGDTPQALAHLFEALEALRSIDAKPQMATLLNNLGTQLLAVGDLEEARRVLEEAAELAKGVDYARLSLELNAHLAECLVYLHQSDAALPIARRLMGDLDAESVASREGNIFTAVALVFLDSQMMPEAAEALARAGTLAEKYASPDARVWVLYLRSLSDSQRGERGSAIALLEAAGAACTPHTPSRLRALVLEKLAALLAEDGRYQEAYALHCDFFEVYEQRLGLATRARYYAVQLRHELNRLRLDRDRARDEAQRDSLTGLHNRRHLDSILAELLALFARTGQPLTLAVIDLDCFKSINDTYGHGFGDEVLRVLAKRLTENTRAGDVVCRIGGEEFCLVFANSVVSDARKRLEEMLAELSATPIRLDDIEASGISFSAGLASYPDDGATGAGLMSAADRALYRAKREGRARVREARIESERSAVVQNDASSA